MTVGLAAVPRYKGSSRIGIPQVRPARPRTGLFKQFREMLPTYEVSSYRLTLQQPRQDIDR